MLEIVKTADIKLFDERAINEYCIPGIILMENAALNCFNFLSLHYSNKPSLTILILCGVGNNGGDGYALARHLSNAGHKVTVLVVGKLEKLSPDAKINYDILLKYKSQNLINIISEKNFSSIRSKNFNVIIDAIFGTGLNSKLKDNILKIIKWANSKNATKISIDIPSGLNANDGFVLGEAFIADFTLTMGFIKLGLLINDGPKYAGEIIVIDISYPYNFNNIMRIKYPEEIDINRLLPQRNYDSHKYSVGKVVILGGSKEYTGAPVLAAESCLKSGCGAAVIISPENLLEIYAKKVKEVMYYSAGKNSEDYLKDSDYENIKEKIRWADVILIGPGLGLKDETLNLINKILIDFPKKKKVIDADAITLLSKTELDKYDLTTTIFTPHLGEFSRLIKIPIENIKNDYINIGLEFTKKYNCTLILKGAPSIAFSRDGYSFINSTGNPGMSTIGMGDVLAGILAGFYAQKMEDIYAAVIANYIHGFAGDLAFKEKNIGLIASDVTNFIPTAINKINNPEQIRAKHIFD